MLLLEAILECQAQQTGSTDLRLMHLQSFCPARQTIQTYRLFFNMCH